MGRKLFLFVGLIAATAGPYLYSKGDVASIKQHISDWFGQHVGYDQPLSVSGPEVTTDSTEQNATATAPSIFQPPGVSPVAVHDHSKLAFHQFFDFAITPDVVVQNWPRVSTSLADMQMSGMRVALVTGTNPDDLHGSLSYYFDQHRRLQRLTFQGRSGDARKLIVLLTQYHGFRANESLGAGFYAKRWNGRIASALWIEHAPLIDEQSSHSRLSVMLEINRTDGVYRLSDEFAQFLEQRDISVRR